ncbi:MAG: helix-turn-helix transcriptional regulator [Ruminococcus sp.]|nr:helix-turn-helix transcriptional regulator [Ruminococcus sp.]
MSTEIKLTTGERIKDLRKAAGLTCEQLCAEIGEKYGYTITKSKYCEIENDIEKDFGFRSFIYLAKYFNVSTDYLLGLTKYKTPNEVNQKVSIITGLSDEAIDVLHHIKNIADGAAFSKETQNDINEIKQHKFWSADEKQEYINYTSEQERKLGETFIDTINAIFTARNFVKFIKELSIYINTDFLKKTPREKKANKSKKIWSVVTDDSNEYDQPFIFDTDLIEQGIFASIQQFLQSLKNKDPKYRLVDIDTISEEEE